jgi:hypothetical protein
MTVEMTVLHKLKELPGCIRSRSCIHPSLYKYINKALMALYKYINKALIKHCNGSIGEGA